MKIKGSLDAALGVADLFSHERSKIYGYSETAASVSATPSSSRDEGQYEGGSPAPVAADIRSRL